MSDSASSSDIQQRLKMLEMQKLSTNPQDLMTMMAQPRQGRSLRMYTYTSLLFLMFGVLISVFIQGGRLFMCSEVYPRHLYSVVFDAGSTGSRMFVFHFKIRDKDDISGTNVKLEEEVFASVEPGVSSYVSRPYLVQKSLEPMLHKAEANVPMKFQPYTLLTVKATAGLRLLPREKGDGVIREMRQLFKQSPFYLPNAEKIAIMDGEEEGLFGWITVNFLLDVLWDDNPDNTATAIDLGGGSLQVTFEVPPGATLSEEKIKKDRFKVKLMHSEFVVFTHSYLGYGLKSARWNILTQTSRHMTRSYEQESENEGVLFTPCFIKGFNMTWEYQETKYYISGTTQSLSSLTACLESVIQFVERERMIQTSLLWNREVHLFSCFYDVARWAGMISPMDYHAMISPVQYLEAAAFYCDSVSKHQEHPFLCMDLLYIYSLLETGLGIPLDKPLHVEKKIVGREVSWSLGAALSTLSRDFSYTFFKVD